MAYEGVPAEALSDVSLPVSYLPETTELDDHPQEECGVFGVFAPGEAVIQMTVIALQELQHRGQSGAGIAYVDKNDSRLVVHKEEGLVPEALAAIYPIPRSRSGIDVALYEESMNSPLAIGHVRYSTAEGEGHAGAHPHLGPESGIALAHNGELHNMVAVAGEFGVSVDTVAKQLGVKPEFVTDSALLTKVIDVVTNGHEKLQASLRKAMEQAGKTYHGYDSLEWALHEVLPFVDGAYSLTITDRTRLIAVRDPWALRPLALGRLDNGGGYTVASESVIFNSLGATYERDFEKGEIVIIDESGVQSSFIDRLEPTTHCGFEYVYTARPDGELDGANVYEVRKKLGRFLAEDHPIAGDVVVGVPSSGLAAAAGYAEAAGLPLVEGIFPNRYSGRTFIERAATGRQLKIGQKYRMNVPELTGQRVILCDDSVIKGNTMQQLVSAVRAAGANEVHVVSSAAAYIHPCFMGMDTHNVDLLVAHVRTNQEIADYIGADSITFNTPKRIQRAVEEAIKDPRMLQKIGTLCTACATGDYPYEVSRPKRMQLGMPAIRGALLGA